MESWQEKVNAHLPEISQFCDFSSTQARKITEMYRRSTLNELGDTYDSIWGVMTAAEGTDGHSIILLKFVDDCIRTIRESQNESIRAVRDAIFNLLVCFDNDRGYKNYIAELAGIRECLQIPAWTVTGYEVPIVWQESDLGTKADLRVTDHAGNSWLLDFVSISYDMLRVEKWTDFESFFLERIRKKREHKTRGADVALSILPVIWGDHETLAKYRKELETLFQESKDFVGPFVITEFSKDGASWHYDIHPAKDLLRAWK